MTTCTLNIGLARNDGLPDNSVNEVVGALLAGGWLWGLKQMRVCISNTEKTVVIQSDLFHAPLGFGVYPLADRLAQDCIAVRDDDTGEGKLIGPGAAKWGDFNPDFFLEASASLKLKGVS